jgi:hypothetical protein
MREIANRGRFWQRPAGPTPSRKFFELADLAEHARRKAEGKAPADPEKLDTGFPKRICANT